MRIGLFYLNEARILLAIVHFEIECSLVYSLKKSPLSRVPLARKIINAERRRASNDNHDVFVPREREPWLFFSLLFPAFFVLVSTDAVNFVIPASAVKTIAPRLAGLRSSQLNLIANNIFSGGVYIAALLRAFILIRRILYRLIEYDPRDFD